jgi:hypothetical protein
MQSTTDLAHLIQLRILDYEVQLWTRCLIQADFLGAIANYISVSTFTVIFGLYHAVLHVSAAALFRVELG